MGNALSPFPANVFMTHLEKLFKEKFTYFPSLYLRYVDDIFAVFDTTKYDLDNFVTNLNSMFPSIKFTVEKEKDNQLPFLDLSLTRTGDKIIFDIYRKPTHTTNYIHNNSFDRPNHKLAVFHSLVYRLFNVPLEKPAFNKELNFIKEIAKRNGYREAIVDKIVKKYKFKHLISKSTTLKKEDNDKYIKLP